MVLEGEGEGLGEEDRREEEASQNPKELSPTERPWSERRHQAMRGRQTPAMLAWPTGPKYRESQL